MQNEGNNFLNIYQKVQPRVPYRKKRFDIYQSNSFDQQKSKNYFHFSAVTFKLIGFRNHFHGNFQSKNFNLWRTDAKNMKMPTSFQYFWILHIITLYNYKFTPDKSMMTLLKLHSIKGTFSLRRPGNHKAVKQRHETTPVG